MQKRQRTVSHPRKAGNYEKHGRYWAVTDAAGRLVCLAVYKKGAQEVLRRLSVAAVTGLVPKRRTRPERKQRQN